MHPPIENPVDCEVRAVIRFLCAQGFKSVDIHHQISEVYGENIMSDGMVQKWAWHAECRCPFAPRTQDLITSFGWEQLDDPPYSPDLAPSKYHLFMHLKKHLAGQRHSNDDETKTTVKQWLSNQVASFFDDGIQKLVPRYDKCLNSNENYVEK
ncbi:uncharacterized protein TNCV_1860401 [Trichonephila clavipes]|nr:uncharacterized protein TNCV_1860401 [Trichonephila clavipes]